MGTLNVATLMHDSLTRQTTEAVRQTRRNIPAAAFKIESEEVDGVTSETLVQSYCGNRNVEKWNSANKLVDLDNRHEHSQHDAKNDAAHNEDQHRFNQRRSGSSAAFDFT